MVGLLYFAVFSSFVLLQLFPQIGFLYHNSTWVEDSMRSQQKEFYQKAKVNQYYAYDHGLIQNLKERLGQNPIQWFLPTPNTDNPYKARYNPSYVPIHKLRVSLVDSFDENSPLLKKYARKRENARDMV
ncbi:hypothetical protein TVAG_247190 [Trichomonas vaginalis G3]|uniref:Uncharacterized protein n=1 Tax=Trichomonas vaginalis (strain ATCC PRA-98 / G3) TaxID=412133 RepID=A2DKQ7_TRIV3|nr:cysteine S-palmitoyltransferase protein [Trichomonas vaginalis G3]EAY19040.1 hypothetical protein TVAG_247190 [Trichomonas vaginalis G3]KAI5521166.1 cysteine S-palmitoyltransferase protein [Trichomonas vaginalis G3]|eukprot:XP_001580026.1 hypothetical protein [Trichomonas vaginalis G3]